MTGASRGIGLELARALAARGAAVGVLARSAEVGELGPRAVALPADVGDRAQVEAAVARFIDEAGGLDLVVANAGIAHYGPFLGQDVEKIEAMTRVNWLGTVYTVKAALGHLVDRASGHIVIVSSGAGLRAFPWAAAYGATKAAQRGVRRGAAARAERLRRVGHDRVPGRDRHPPARPREGLAARLVPRRLARGRRRGSSRRRCCGRSRRTSARSPIRGFVRLLGLNGIAPRFADAVVRRLRGGTAAPRRD